MTSQYEAANAEVDTDLAPAADNLSIYDRAARATRLTIQIDRRDGSSAPLQASINDFRSHVRDVRPDLPDFFLTDERLVAAIMLRENTAPWKLTRYVLSPASGVAA
jgi:hypothetical protein